MMKRELKDFVLQFRVSAGKSVWKYNQLKKITVLHKKRGRLKEEKKNDALDFPVENGIKSE